MKRSRHPLEFDGKCSNPNHWLFTGGDFKHKVTYLMVAGIMYTAGWIIGGMVWALAMIDRRKHGLAHNQKCKGMKL